MKKTICLGIWILISVLYILNARDTGRSDGAQIQSAFETYTQAYTEEYVGAEGLADAIANNYIYTNMNNLEEKFKSSYTGDGVITVIYMGLSIFLYHTAYSKSKISVKEEETKERDI